jgi:hypothetical protein
MQNQNNRALIRISVIIIAVLLLIGIIVDAVRYASQRKLTASITLQVSPTEAAVTLNGKKVTANTKDPIKVVPGKYTATASLKGFATETQTVTVKKGGNQYIGIALSSNTDSTANWYASHPNDENISEQVGGQQYNAGAELELKNNPIIADLPHIDNEYRIDYGVSVAHPSTPGAVGIYITYYDADGLQQALQWIQFKGYNPNNMELIEKAAASPF